MTTHPPATELEQAESHYWKKLYDPLLREEVHGATVVCHPGADILAFNRVMGAGLQKPLTDEALEHFIRFFRKYGVPRFMVQLVPEVQSPQIVEQMISTGFRPHNYWAKLWAPIRQIRMPDARSYLKIVPVGRGDAGLYASIILQTFEWSGELHSFFAGSVGLEDYRHFFALYNDEPVAAAAMHIAGPYASMAMAGTLPAFRGLGAQKALLAHRIELAASLGCQYVVTETGKDTEAQPNKSYRNMRRIGLELAYHRRNYVFEFHPAGQ